MYMPYNKAQPQKKRLGIFKGGESEKTLQGNRHFLHHRGGATETRNHDPEAKGEMSREFAGAIQTNALLSF